MQLLRPVSYLTATGLLLFLAVRGADTKSSVEEQIWQHRNLGKAFYENPTTQQQAVDEFKKALALAPNSARERLNYGLALLRAGKTSEGVAELEKVQKQDPKLPHTWFNLGIVFKKDGQFDKAQDQFEKMLSLTPNEPVAHYNVGVLYKQAGRNEDAAREIELSARLNTNLAAPHFQLYNVYRTMGRREDAARELKTFQDLKKSQEGAAIAEDMEWCDYAEVYDPIDMRVEDKPVTPKYEARKLAGAVDPQTAGMRVIDADGDGRPDLLVWSAKGVALYRNGTDPVKNFGLESLTDVISVAPGDFDNDGLTDLCVLTAGGPQLWHNDKGKFSKVASSLPSGRFEKAVWLDYDHDYDLDLFLFGEKSALYRNQGQAGFTDHTADFPFVAGKALDAVHFRVLADSKSFDLVASYADRTGVIYRDDLGGKFHAEPIDAVAAGAKGLRAGDFNRDSWLDLAFGTTILLSDRKGGFTSSQGEAKTFAEADFDNDGRIDYVEIKDDGLVFQRNITTPVRTWIRVALSGVKNLKLGMAAQVEVKAGTRYEKQVYEGLPLTFDLGSAKEADTVRITWANGLIQNETKQAANRSYTYKEAQRLSGSCPMIWTWNGSGFEFITDVLGVAPLGASSGDGTFFPVDHDEYVSIPGEALALREGKYEVRISEELSEVAFIDQIQLEAIDHPANQRIYTNEKFKAPPFPEFRLFGVRSRIDPVAARDGDGHDVRAALLKRDRVYPDQFRRTDSGIAETHNLDLDFGAKAAPDNKALLVLSGWVDWADGSTFMAASQETKTGLVTPYLQVKDERGEWKTVIEDMGMPAGKPKTMVVDLSGKFLSKSREIRIVTNVCVYWDEIFLSNDTAAPELMRTVLPAATAEVRFRGFSQSIIHPQRKQPEQFIYAASSPLSYWNPTPGMYTRYGDVRELIAEPDDRFVIMSSGDELRFAFDPSHLPQLPKGWRRDFLLKVDGWAKDRDANTAHSQSVEPYPFHAMSSYPYPASEHFPEDEKHRAWKENYNVRPALRLIRPLVDSRH